MNNEANREHWDKIYLTKKPSEVSWTQENPKISLDFIHSFNLAKSASIIDIGGGDSRLVDKLVEEGFEDITVLDISEQALKKAKDRLGKKGGKVKWVVADITEFKTEKKFDLWHDRATFHFMISLEQISQYLEIAEHSLRDNGLLTIGTFSESGPKICSGLEVKQYSETTLQHQLEKGFKKLKCVMEDHKTPFETLQNFLFCSFRRQIIQK
ncbi:class I SAM-dependent methyltransferase [soil metagenome]